MSPSPPAHEVLDLCSDEDAPPERQYKRHRKEDVRQAFKQPNPIIDLSVSSPEEQDQGNGLPAGIAPPTTSQSRDRRLWGEVETDSPPRWNHARRRSSLCPSSMLPEAMPAMNTRSGSANLQEEPHEKQQQQQSQHQQWPSRHRMSARHTSTNPPNSSSTPLPAPLSSRFSDTGHRRQTGLQSDAALAQRLQEREEAAALRRAQHQARRREEEDELSRRISELEELEAIEEMAENNCRPHRTRRSTAQPPEATAAYRPPLAYSQQSRSGGRRPLGWAPASLAEAMMGMLSDGGSLAHMQLGALSQHVAAVRHAMGALQGPGRLPAHLLFSDRDFDENDYEALLALDDSVVSRKGASSEEIESIPTVVFGKGRGHGDAGCRCPICLEDIEQGALLRKMACKHCFHKDCLDKWLSHKSVCPICQQQPQ